MGVRLGGSDCKLNTFLNKVSLYLSTLIGVGRFPYAPGTAGTVVAMLIRWKWTPTWWELLIVFFVGVYITSRAEKVIGTEDPPQVVWDEMLGYFVAMYGFSPKSMVAALVFFRIFDILKGFPISRVEKLRGGWGIMLDDVIAGIESNLLLWAIVSYYGIKA